MSKYEWDNHKDTNFSEFERFFRDSNIQPIYDTRSDYTTNAPSFYEYLARHNHLIKILAKRIYDYDKELAKRFEEWDKRIENLPKELEELLIEWLQDGTLEEIINVNIFEQLQTNKQPRNAIYKLKPLVEIPVRFPDYNKIVGEHDLKNIYPSAFDIDWENNLLFLVSLGALQPSGVMQDRIITMYDITSGEYKGYFYAGIYGGEGIVVKWENNKRYLYCQNGMGYLGKYDITLLPKNASKLESIEDIFCNVHWTFGYDGANWLITQGGAEKGYKDQRRTHAYYSDSFKRLGYILTDTKDTGYFNSDYYSNNTKIQSMTIGNGKIYMGIGAYHADGRQGEQGKIGIKVLDSSGNLIETGLMNSQKVIDKLNDMDKNADILENEGVHVKRDDGRVFSLMIFRNPERNEHANKGGIYIMEHYSSDLNAIDFSDCSSTLLGTTIEGQQPLSFQDPDGKMFLENHLTGERLNSMSDILTYMVNDYRDEFSFYSSNVTIKWFDNETLGGSRFVKIHNTNNIYFIIEVFGYKNRPNQTYFVNRDFNTGDIKEIINITPESLITEYLYEIDDLHNLDFGYYEVVLNNKMFNLPKTFPNSNALTLVTVKGSSTRKQIELHVPTTNQTFTTSIVNGFKNGYVELSQGGKLIDFNSQTKKKYLFIGNSFTYDSTRRKLRDTLLNIDENYTIGMIYQAGSDLNYHYNQIKNNEICQYYKVDKDNDWVFNTNITINEVLQDEEWEVICLNQISGYSGIYESFYPTLNNIVDLIKNRVSNNVQFGLLMPWAYATNSDHVNFSKYDNSQIKMYNEISDTHELLLKHNSHIDFVIPQGTMIQNARNTILRDINNEITRDGYHLDYYKGRELATLLTYSFMTKEKITNQLLEDNEFTFDGTEKQLVIDVIEKSLQKPFGVD